MPRTPSTWPAMATGSSRSTGGGVACTSLPSGLVGRCVGQGLRRHRFCRAVAGAAHRRFSRLSRAVLCGAGGKPAADWKSARPAAGAAAAMLVLGNHLWFTLSTLCLSSTRADSCGPKSSSTRQQPIPTTQENQVLFPEAFVPDGSRFLHSCPGRDSRLVAHLPPPRIRSHRVLRRARRRLRQRLPQELPQRHVPRSSHPGPCDPRGPRDPASHRLPRSRRSHSLSNWRYLHKPGPSTSDPPSCTSPSPCSRLHPPTASRRVDPGRSLRRILQLRAAAAKRPVLLRQPVGRAAAGASGLALFRNRDFPATSWRVCRNWKARGSHACRNGTSTPPSRSRPPSCRNRGTKLSP